MTILVLTVGGSPQPIVTAIQRLKPDRVVFLCSDDGESTKGSYTEVIGQGSRSRPGLERPDRPNVVTQAGLRDDQFEIVRVRDFDSLEACHHEAATVLTRVRREWPEATIVADYTGGTKSMSAGLAIAAVDDQRCEINLVTGTRADRDRVQDHTQYAQPVTVWDLRARRELREVDVRLSRFDYSGSEGLLTGIAGRPLTAALRRTITTAIAICRGLDAWDRFDHEEARRLLTPHRRHLVRECQALDDLCRSEPRDPYGRAGDLLFNAERRADQGRFDDAIARAYRSLELVAQVRLRTRHGIDTAEVDLSRVPEDARESLERHRTEKGRIKIGLLAAWDLLARYGDTPAGGWFGSRRDEILGLLQTRNDSILAHGLTSVDATRYGTHGARMIDLCREAVTLIHERDRIKPMAVQLPRALASLAGTETAAIGGGRPGVALDAADHAAVREFAERVRTAFVGRLVALKLFGSKARGDDVPESDIDVLVLVEEATTAVEDAVLNIAFDVNLEHDVYISPRVLGRTAFDDPVWKATPFLQAVEREGIPL